MDNTLKIQPIRELVASKIRNKIFLGELKPGEYLKQEELAKEFGVSRMPVREAINQLVAEGFVEAAPNKSAMVSRFSTNYIQDYFDVRILLESKAIELAMKDDGLLSLLKDINRQYKDAFRQNNREKINELNFQFHTTIWNFSRNFKLISMLNNLWNGLPENYDAVDLSKTVDEHENIIAAIEKNDTERAITEIDCHITMSMNRYMQVTKK